MKNLNITVVQETKDVPKREGGVNISPVPETKLKQQGFIQYLFREYVPFGYTVGYFDKSNTTLHLYRY